MSTGLAPVPTSHAELRARLEAAGVPAEQIAAVLLHPSPSPNTSSTFPSHATSSTCPLPLSSPPSPPSPTRDYTVSFLRKETVYPGTQYTHSIHLSTDPPTNPIWTSVFLHKIRSELRVYRHNDGSPQTKPAEICRASFSSSGINRSVRITYPWAEWHEDWLPEDMVWSSYTDGSEAMQWVYGTENEQKETILDCVVAGAANEQIVNRLVDSGKARGQRVCRAVVVRNQTGGGRIELYGDNFKDNEKMADEMVGNALVQIWRQGMGWQREARRTNEETASAGSNQALSSGRFLQSGSRIGRTEDGLPNSLSDGAGSPIHDPPPPYSSIVSSDDGPSFNPN